MATDETGYQVERTAAGKSVVISLPANAVSHRDENLIPETTYSYRVRAVRGAVWGAWSGTVSAVTLPDLPAAPGALTATPLSASTVRLLWSDRSTNENAFEIERAVEGAPFSALARVEAGTTAFSDPLAPPESRIVYRIRAVNARGGSAWVSASVVTPALPPFVDLEPEAFELSFGTVVAGGARDRRADDGMALLLREEERGSPTSVNGIQATWRFDVALAERVAVVADAWGSRSDDRDRFIVEWTRDGSTWEAVGETTDGEDGGPIMTAALPAGTHGDVLVRVRDTDRRPGATGLDHVAIDWLTIRSFRVVDAVRPARPGEPAAEPGVNGVRITWADNSDNEFGFRIDRSVEGRAWTTAAMVGPGTRTWLDRDPPLLVPVVYRVTAYNAAGVSSDARSPAVRPLPVARLPL